MRRDQLATMRRAFEIRLGGGDVSPGEIAERARSILGRKGSLDSALRSERCEQAAPRRRQHHAEHRPAGIDQPDVHGEIVSTPNEFARAVERIDQEQPASAGERRADEAPFLGKHGNARGGGGEPFENDRLGLAVGDRDRRAVLLDLDLEARPPVSEQARARGGERGEQSVGEIGVIETEHGTWSRVIRALTPPVGCGQAPSRDHNDSIPEQKQGTRLLHRFRPLQGLGGACINADKGFGKRPVSARQRGHR